MTRLKSANGFSLVEVMVASAVASIVAMVIISLLQSFNQESASLSEKMSALELERSASGLLSSTATCNPILDPSNLAAGSSLSFDAFAVQGGTPFKIALKGIPFGGPQNFLVQTGVSVSGVSTRLTVDKIELVVSSVNPTLGRLNVNFDQNRTVRAIHNLSFPIGFVTSGIFPHLTLTGCTSAMSTLGTLGTCPAGQVLNGFSPNGGLSCIPASSGSGVSKQCFNGHGGQTCVCCTDPQTCWNC